MGVKHKSVQEAIEYVARHPDSSDIPLVMPIWELVARQLYAQATVVTDNPRQLKKVSAAQKILAERKVGRRRPGSAPAVKKETRIVVADFTKELPE